MGFWADILSILLIERSEKKREDRRHEALLRGWEKWDKEYKAVPSWLLEEFNAKWDADPLATALEVIGDRKFGDDPEWDGPISCTTDPSMFVILLDMKYFFQRKYCTARGYKFYTSEERRRLGWVEYGRREVEASKGFWERLEDSFINGE